jgi:hypothetical protein
MKKRFSVLMLVVVLLFTFSGCSLFESGTDEGVVGKVYKTQWFNFEVRDYEVMYEYNEIPSYDGFKYVVFTIWEKNTFEEAIPMAPMDFELESPSLDYNDTLPYGSSAFGYYEKCMPDSFMLDPKEEVEYEVVFEIPEDIMEVAIFYLEIDAEEKEGAKFRIPIDLN